MKSQIPLTPVTSSLCKAIGHDGTTLAVEMHNGKVYHYHDVPAEVHQELLAAKSLGAQFGKSIRGMYKHSIIEPDRGEVNGEPVVGDANDYPF